jgi:hypothetical protein
LPRVAAAVSLGACAIVAFFWIRSLYWYDYRLSIGGTRSVTLRSHARQCAFTVSVVRRPEWAVSPDATELEVERYWWATGPTRRHHPPPPGVFPWFSVEPVKLERSGAALFADPDESVQTPVIIGHTVLLPQWAVLLATAVLPAWTFALRTGRRTRRWRRRRVGSCPSCGYDLTGNASGVCPECGTGLGVG